jgi:hypothetical protein
LISCVYYKVPMISCSLRRDDHSSLNLNFSIGKTMAPPTNISSHHHRRELNRKRHFRKTAYNFQTFRLLAISYESAVRGPYLFIAFSRACQYTLSILPFTVSTGLLLISTISKFSLPVRMILGRTYGDLIHVFTPQSSWPMFPK